MNNLEKEILQSISLGDRVAFRKLFDTYYKSLCAYIYNFFRNAEECENMAQDIFLSIWEKRETLNSIQNIKSYLFQSAHYQCLNHLKKQKVKDSFSSEVSYQLKQMELEESDELVSQENVNSINKAIASLPEQRRKVFLMKRIEGKSYKEISAELGISERTVETHVAHAMKHLKQMLGHLISFSMLFSIISNLITGFSLEDLL